MRASHRFPVARDVDDVDACADDVLKARAGFHERALDVLQRLFRLRIRVAGADDRSVGRRRRRARHADVLAHPDRARVADDRLPRRPARNVFALHSTLLYSVEAAVEAGFDARSDPLVDGQLLTGRIAKDQARSLRDLERLVHVGPAGV